MALSNCVHAAQPYSLVKAEWKDRIALSNEDYLHGVISVVNELVCIPSEVLVVSMLNKHLAVSSRSEFCDAGQL